MLAIMESFMPGLVATIPCYESHLVGTTKNRNAMYVILPVALTDVEFNMLPVTANHVRQEHPDMILGYAYYSCSSFL